MSDTKRAVLHWTGEGLAFRGGAPDGPELTLDGDGEAGPSPMDALLQGLGGCMAIDVVHILERSRVPLEALEVEVEGTRAPEAPRRFTGIRLVYRVRGPGPDDEGRLKRAVDLSRDRYCSVLHTLRPDMEIEIRIERR